jgi:hypothetical protein
MTLKDFVRVNGTGEYPDAEADMDSGMRSVRGNRTRKKCIKPLQRDGV